MTKELRKELNLTQKQLSEKLDVASITVSRWERGIQSPRGKNLQKIVNLENEIRRKEWYPGLGAKSVSLFEKFINWIDNILR